METIERNDKDIRLFKLIGSMPQHTPGDLLYLPHIRADHCIWIDEPYYKMDLTMIENSPEHFEELFIDFKSGDPYHFINLNGTVISDLFYAQKYAHMLRYGNGFKTVEEAEWANEQIRKFFTDKGQVLNSRDFIQIIQWIQDSTKSVAIKKIRDRYLF